MGVFIHEWARCEAQSRCSVGIDQFADWSSGSRRTAYNRLREFRESFPGVSTPSDLIVWPDGHPAPEAVERIDWTAALA